MTSSVWWSAFIAVARRTWLKTLRRPVVLTFSFVQPLLWLVFFGFLFQRLSVGDLAVEGTYITFLVPGICAMTVLFGASQSGIELVRDAQSGFLDRMTATPVHRTALLGGKIAADVARLLGQALVVVFLGAALGATFRPSLSSLVGAVVSLALFGWGFASLSCAIALLTRRPETMGVFVHVVNMPILFTSTALVPRPSMPGWLAAVATWNPLTTAVDALRPALVGVGEAPSLLRCASLSAVAAALFLLALAVLRRT